jgi:flagellar biosynthesis protein FlhB
MMSTTAYEFAKEAIDAQNGPTRPDEGLVVFARTPLFEFDLQIFAEDSPTGQKTEPATPWRREEARKQGQVAKSVDLVTVALLFFGFLALYFSGRTMLEEMTTYSAKLLGALETEVSAATIARLNLEAFGVMGRALAPIFAITLGAMLLAGFGQAGFYFTMEPLKPNFGRMNPANGFKRIFSMQSVEELVKTLVKIVAIAYIPYRFLRHSYNDCVGMFAASPWAMMEKLSKMTFDVSMQVIMVLLVLAIIDYFYQRYEFEKSIMMSRYDLMREIKQREGNPLVKNAMRQQMRALASRRMMEAIPKAEVVITNPTHIAIALAYDGDKHKSPTVVAKGAGQVADKIKEVARDHQVPIHEHKPLAQALYKSVEIGEEIPQDLYVPVADVLAIVFKMKKRPAA